ncbi:hypothetical protein EMCRGX_G004698 [Ephydatia muelleri]
MLDFPEAGIRDALVVAVKEEKESQNDRTLMKGYRRVAFVEEFWDILKQIHNNDGLHAGVKKTFARVQGTYSFLPRSVVEQYVKLCSACHLRKPQATKPPLRPIVADGLLSRLQIDLIDMRHLPDGDFKWILHIIDHWSKFNLAFPLINKGAHNVAEVLEKYVFPIVGLPSILHSDNGREFVNSVIKEILNDWPGQVQLVSGRPRHPQSQGVVEQAHYTLERMLSAKVAEQKSCKPPWSMWLPHIVYTMNTQVHETTKQMPYELVFGQPPRSIIIPDPRLKAMIDEEQLDEKDTVTCKSDDEDKESNHDDSSSVGIIEDLKHNEEEKNEGNGTELEGIAANTEEELPEDAEDSGGFEEIRSESSLPRSLERMGQKYSKHNGHHIKKFAVGDSVSVRVPRIDRANTDLQRLPCIVVEIVGKGLFHVSSLLQGRSAEDLLFCWGFGTVQCFL